MVPLVPPALDQYVRDLIPARDPVLAEMEAFAAENDVPIVGPAVGTLLEVLARSIGASRVFEMGSAIGYSTAFFARAVGRGGQVFYTDGRSGERGEGAGLPRAHGPGSTGSRSRSATRSLRSRVSNGYFDVIFIDIDKDGYPDGVEGGGAARPARRVPARRQRPLVGQGRGPGGPATRRPRASATSTAALFALQEFRSASSSRCATASPSRGGRAERGGRLPSSSSAGARSSRRANRTSSKGRFSSRHSWTPPRTSTRRAGRSRRSRGARAGRAGRAASLAGALARPLRGGGLSRRRGVLRRAVELLGRARARASPRHADHALDRRRSRSRGSRACG